MHGRFSPPRRPDFADYAHALPPARPMTLHALRRATPPSVIGAALPSQRNYFSIAASMDDFALDFDDIISTAEGAIFAALSTPRHDEMAAQRDARAPFTIASNAHFLFGSHSSMRPIDRYHFARSRAISAFDESPLRFRNDARRDDAQCNTSPHDSVAGA